METKRNIALSVEVLDLDLEKEAERICGRLREILSRDLMRRGYVIAMSGGIDSSVSAALCVRALGKERVYGLLLPERDSSGAKESSTMQLLSNDFSPRGYILLSNFKHCWIRLAAIYAIYPAISLTAPTAVIHAKLTSALMLLHREQNTVHSQDD